MAGTEFNPRLRSPATLVFTVTTDKVGDSAHLAPQVPTLLVCIRSDTIDDRRCDNKVIRTAPSAIDEARDPKPSSFHADARSETRYTLI